MRRWGIAAVGILAAAGCGGGSSVTGPSDPLPTSTPAAAKPEVWIVWGQSNALGCAEGPGNTAPHVEAWAGGTWAPAEEPLPFMDHHEGCESGWAVTAAGLVGRPVRLTGHAHVAKPVRYWLKDPTKFLANLADAKSAKWLIVYQGESDAERRSTTWASDFAQLVQLARGATNPELRVLVIGLADEPSTVGRNLWNNLREQQRAYVSSDPLAVFATAEGLQVQDDEVHLTRAGYAALAARVAAVVR